MNNNCSNHKKYLFGESDMKVVAEAIGDLNYESLSRLLFELQTKIHNDSMKYLKDEKFKLSHALHRASVHLWQASFEIESAWQISKPFMKD